MCSCVAMCSVCCVTYLLVVAARTMCCPGCCRRMPGLEWEMCGGGALYAMHTVAAAMGARSIVQCGGSVRQAVCTNVLSLEPTACRCVVPRGCDIRSKTPSGINCYGSRVVLHGLVAP